MYILFRTIVQSNVWRFTSFLSSSIFQWSPNCHPATIQVDFATNPELLQPWAFYVLGAPTIPKTQCFIIFPMGCHVEACHFGGTIFWTKPLEEHEIDRMWLEASPRNCEPWRVVWRTLQMSHLQLPRLSFDGKHVRYTQPSHRFIY